MRTNLEVTDVSHRYVPGDAGRDDHYIIPGAGGALINAYFARPSGPGPFPAVVLIHHLPGWDEWYREATRKFAHHGYLADLSCPLLGLFGEEDRSPSPEQVARHEEALKKHGKVYEFHMYPRAGHGFFYHDRPSYRQEAAMDGWRKVFAFLQRHLAPTGR